MFEEIRFAEERLNGAAQIRSPTKAPGRRMHLESRLTHPVAIVIMLSSLMGNRLLAGDSWEKKRYTQWTESEALQVLQDSAWSKLSFVWVNAGTLVDAPESRGTTGEVRIEQHSNCCRTFTRVVDGSAPEDSSTSTASGNSGSIRQVLYYRVLIYSSARVRQALARLRQLRGQTLDAQANASLEKSLDDLVIAVAGPNMGPFENAARETLLASTFLRSRKRGKERAELKDYVPPGLQQDGLALFVFSRKVEGRPVFNAADDLFEFGTGEGAFKIRASFKLEKLVVDGVPDF